MTAIANQIPCFTQQADKSTRKKTIQVIENNPVIAELLVHILHLSEYSCSIMDRHDRTFPTWRENSLCTPPDGIILDADIRTVKLKNPFDVIQTVGKQWRATCHIPPLILLTTDPVGGTELQQKGYTVVMKPFKLMALLSTVRAAIEGKCEEGTIEGRQHDDTPSWH